MIIFVWSCKLARNEAVKELPAMLSNFGFLCETYLVGSCETKCWANLVSLDLLGPSHGILRTTSVYCLLHWISRVQIADSSPLRWVKNWPSACLSLVFYRCQQVRPRSGQVRILSFLECQHVPAGSGRYMLLDLIDLDGWLASIDDSFPKAVIWRRLRIQ